MKLSRNDIDSAAWRKVREWANSELSRYRSQIESDKSEIHTAKLRGQIASLKELIRLEVDAERPEVPSLDHLYPK